MVSTVSEVNQTYFIHCSIRLRCLFGETPEDTVVYSLQNTDVPPGGPNLV